MLKSPKQNSEDISNEINRLVGRFFAQALEEAEYLTFMSNSLVKTEHIINLEIIAEHYLTKGEIIRNKIYKNGEIDIDQLNLFFNENPKLKEIILEQINHNFAKYLTEKFDIEVKEESHIPFTVKFKRELYVVERYAFLNFIGYIINLMPQSEIDRLKAIPKEQFIINH